MCTGRKGPVDMIEDREYAVKTTEAGETLARELASWERARVAKEWRREMVDEAERMLNKWADDPGNQWGAGWARDWWAEMREGEPECQIAVKCALVNRVGYLPPFGMVEW